MMMMMMMIADGNATVPDSGVPLFMLQPDDGRRGADLFISYQIDVNYGLRYHINVIASRRQLDDSEVENWNGTRLYYVIHIVDLDNNGPTFDSDLPGLCRGIGKSVERGR